MFKDACMETLALDLGLESKGRTWKSRVEKGHLGPMEMCMQ